MEETKGGNIWFPLTLHTREVIQMDAGAVKKSFGCWAAGNLTAVLYSLSLWIAPGSGKQRDFMMAETYLWSTRAGQVGVTI